MLACADTPRVGTLVRGSGADCWRCDAFAKSVITWPRVCEGCPTICQPYTSLSPVSRLPCYAAAGPKGRRLRTSRRWRKFRGQPRAVFTQGGPPARSASPIARMSAEQPRLALADLTKKLPESIARASSAKSVAQQGQRFCPPLAIEFFGPSSADGHGHHRPGASDKQAGGDSVLL